MDTHNETCGCCPAPGTVTAILPPEVKIEGTLDPPQKQYSRAEIGRMRQQYITKGPFETVIACGHNFHPTAEPKYTNCPDCWEAFFNVHTGVIAASQSIITAFGFDQLVKCRGTKFCKYYTVFVNKKNQEHECR